MLSERAIVRLGGQAIEERRGIIVSPLPLLDRAAIEERRGIIVSPVPLFDLEIRFGRLPRLEMTDSSKLPR